MKKTALLISLFIILFSCNHNTEIKKNHVIAKDSIVKKEDTIAEKNTDTISTKNSEAEKIKVDKGLVVLLPNNRYAVIVLDYDIRKDRDCIIKKVKVYDRTTKKQVPETRIDDYFANQHDRMDDDKVWYGDFNFDGKMDVAVRGEESGYRNFCYWNFYLATSKGYKFSKSFSKIMDDPIAYFELDAKNKKIIAYRQAEYDNSFEYKIENNKANLIKFTSEGSRIGPFYDHHETSWIGKKEITTDKRTIKEYNEEILSFDIENSREKIVLFINEDYSPTLYYSLVKSDSSVVFDYSENFNYSIKNNLLVFKDKNKTYKVYESKTNVGVEIIEKGKTRNLIGNFKSKKGSLSRIISLKRNEEYSTNSNFENVVIEK